MLSRYQAAMVLSGVGDAMGYKSGDWEFNFVGQDIHHELRKLGGLKALKIKLPDWQVSDDTVLHLATAEALATNKPVGDDLFAEIAFHYKKGGTKDMKGRAPGATTMNALHQLKPMSPKGYIIPFNNRGGGCGAAMRAMCIGLRYNRPEQLEDLIAVSVESGRMTHNHPTGFLGSLASALFTSFAVQGKPVHQWGAALMSTLPKVMEYIKSVGRDVEQNESKWNYFEEKWKSYLDLRGISDGTSGPKFPEVYGIKERDEFYKSVSFSGWGGASGHDAPMIAYDALLGAGDSWKEFCLRGILHGGDNDSTGAIGACWWGALYGMKDVPLKHYEKLEYRARLETVGQELYKLSHPE
ncbi:protein ADP-ribosylarginine hydrolase-like [Asterias rubens]|uniref:protein ADP-ribosylarginine hydrolase-like n=1 Tax=Asterias rubens TaxID=7604 RepID=UPI001455404D|nr:protein ADP-ribosylarginine hydrolase-like [Asterias rubens]XP_033630076.1 protein ADP-ribosylarginine hydrolase-like [Asterias rubens]XP_033630078.1 protein ADP-ribosylarginine hydrolase-like [Asterias rubens]